MKLAKPVELFVMLSIIDLLTAKYCHNFEKYDSRKIKYSRRIKNWKYIFTSLSTMGRYLFSIHPKKLIILKNRKDILSVITNLGNNVNGGKNVLLLFNGYI